MIKSLKDSDGRHYSVWAQNQPMSCTIASLWMGRSLVHQTSFAEGEWSLAQRYYYAAVQNADAPLGLDPKGPQSFKEGTGKQGTLAYRLASEGFYKDEIYRALVSDGLKVEGYKKGRGPLHIDKRKLSATTPALIIVDWLNGGRHMLVAAQLSSGGKIVYLDPWGGHLTEQDNNGSYSAPYGNFGASDIVFYISKGR
ncbi:MAG: hypothetical protein AAF127_07965 [Pseudomonadota bacterium]